MVLLLFLILQDTDRGRVRERLTHGSRSSSSLDMEATGGHHVFPAANLGGGQHESTCTVLCSCYIVLRSKGQPVSSWDRKSVWLGKLPIRVRSKEKEGLLENLSQP